MKMFFKKFVAVVLCVGVLLSAVAVGAVAKKSNFNEIPMDYPIVYIPGLQGDYYKGMSTETTEDDQKIWMPSGEIMVYAIAKNLAGVLVSVITENGEHFTDAMTALVSDLFDGFFCDENGNPDPDTGKNIGSDLALKNGYGYENAYEFTYDWRLDVKTISAQLDEYIHYVMDLTKSDKVGLVTVSMGCCITLTYLYENYYTKQEKPDYIAGVFFGVGAMNGVGSCEDPFLGQVSVDSRSLMRFLSEIMQGNTGVSVVFSILEILYLYDVFEPIMEVLNGFVDDFSVGGYNQVIEKTFATIPGFFTLMSGEGYENAKAYIFDTPEKQEKYGEIIEKSDYYHQKVQVNNENIIHQLIKDKINVGILAEYGCTFVPLTSDNERMSDGIIGTEQESFGAICSTVDGTLGESYVQAKECLCGKNHVSPDNQIDASTCTFADITWFGKYIRHKYAPDVIGNLVNTVIYSNGQIDVWSYEDLPQFLKQGDSGLIPLESHTVVPYEKRSLKEILMSLVSLV